MIFVKCESLYKYEIYYKKFCTFFIDRKLYKYKYILIYYNMFECILCNYSHENRKNFLQHCNTKNHIIKEETNNRCCICNKSYKSSITYKKHKKNIHGNTIINIKNIIEDKNIEENNKININKTTKLKKIMV